MSLDPAVTALSNQNLYSLLHSRFAGAAQQPCIHTGERTWTYGEVEAHAGRIANVLRQAGAGPGDRVAVQVQKSAEAVCLYLATLRAGCAYLPLNTAYPAAELDYFLGDAEPAIVVCEPAREQEMQALGHKHGATVMTLGSAGEGSLMAAASGAGEAFEAHACDGEALAAILYTSGTTGRPKGAMLSHANLASNALVLHERWGFGPDDVLLHALPIFHTHGLFVALNTTLLNATPMHLLPRYDVAEVMRLLPRSRVFMGVPTFYVRLLNEASFGSAQCANMRLFVSGSAPLLAQTHEEFEQRTGHVILERYGMTECGMSTSNPLVGARKPGTVGPPLPGVDLRVVDEQGSAVPAGTTGGVEFIGPNVFSGYWRNPEKTAEDFTLDGFFRSGDLGQIDADGYLSIVGRAKDLVISGGFNVYPKEVESCLDDLAGVTESAVIGVPDKDFGERVVAVVVADTGASLAPAAVIAELKTQLAGYKVPKAVHIVEALPRNAMGKVQKNLLREQYSTGSNS